MTALIAFRAVQGLGAGAITPTTITIAGDIYTVRERARTQGYIASVWAFASVAGPTMGGLFSQFLSWRWIFWINVPLCLHRAFMLWRNYRHPFERHPQRIDYAGAVLLTAALVLIVLGLLEGGHALGVALVAEPRVLRTRRRAARGLRVRRTAGRRIRSSRRGSSRAGSS